MSEKEKDNDDGESDIDWGVLRRVSTIMVAAQENASDTVNEIAETIDSLTGLASSIFQDDAAATQDEARCPSETLGIAATQGEARSSTTQGEARSSSKTLFLSESDVDINYRKPLGTGGFCVVYSAKVRVNDRELGPLALKRLRHAVVQNKNLCDGAAADLAREAEILQKVSHENIIKVYGIQKQENEKDSAEKVDPASFFMVMDVLSVTLESHLQEWEKQRSVFRQVTPQESVVTRIRDVGLGIANGMEYLHSKQVIFRDLKPANIGFSNDGTVKIFDFGLAKEIVGGSCRGRVGTLRYMAPEVSRNEKPYGLSADVYSYSILLWQIVTSRTPFENEIDSFSAPTNLPENLRPSFKFIESKELQALLTSGWATTPGNRPCFHDISLELGKIITLKPITKPEKEAGKERKRKMMWSSIFHR